MAWWVQPQQLADPDGSPSGKWRMTATSDEDGGGPFGNPDCFHASADEAESCESCDDYMAMISGFPPRKRQQPQPMKRPTEWLPIETAPHNEQVLLYCPERGIANHERIELGYASHGRRVGETSSVSAHSWATHWMPLPEPPNP